jgi:cytochrome P450
LHKLRQEIDLAASAGHCDDDLPRFSELTKLPYLTAVINEGLRLSPSVGGTFTRRVPAGGAEVLTDDIVSPGTVVGVNNWVMGRNINLYGPDAETFKPERWLDEANRKKLKDYDFSFGHGARV